MATLNETIISRLQDSIDVKQKLIESDQIDVIRDMSLAVVESLKKGGKVIFAGNGGSFADSIHLAGEFVSRFTMEREPLSGLALGANNSILTAVGNDYDYSDVFLREIKALGREGDVFIGISTSGNSPNIVACVEAADKMGITSYAMTGEKACKLHDMCTSFKAPSGCTPRIQETHIAAGHILCELVERMLCDPEFDAC